MKAWLGRPAAFAAIAAAILAAAPIVATHVHQFLVPGTYLEQQDYLRREIARLDVEIREVKDLRAMEAKFLARSNVIEFLHGERRKATQVLNELARQRPKGIRFVSVGFAHGRVKVVGVADSEDALRAFTSAVAASAVLQAPQDLATRGSEFAFVTSVRRAKG